MIEIQYGYDLKYLSFQDTESHFYRNFDRVLVIQ